MYQITKLAESLDLTKIESSMQIKEILQKYNLPYECQVETKNLIQAISLDKKNINNSLSVVLLKEIGDSYVYQTNQEFLLKKKGYKMSQIKLIPTKLKGKVSVPPSKSLAHRAIIAN